MRWRIAKARYAVSAVVAVFLLCLLAISLPWIEYCGCYPYLSWEYGGWRAPSSPDWLLETACHFKKLQDYKNGPSAVYVTDRVRLDALRLLLAAQGPAFGVPASEVGPLPWKLTADNRFCKVVRSDGDRVLLMATPSSRPSSVEELVDETENSWAIEYLLFRKDGKLLDREWDTGGDSRLLPLPTGATDTEAEAPADGAAVHE